MQVYMECHKEGKEFLFLVIKKKTAIYNKLKDETPKNILRKKEYLQNHFQ